MNMGPLNYRSSLVPEQLACFASNGMKKYYSTAKILVFVIMKKSVHTRSKTQRQAKFGVL